MTQKVYGRIEDVLRKAGVSLAPHEFEGIEFRVGLPAFGNALTKVIGGREYVGCSESALGRRLREMREIGRVTSQRREGTAFVEYALAVRVPCPEPLCPI